MIPQLAECGAVRQLRACSWADPCWVPQFPTAGRECRDGLLLELCGAIRVDVWESCNSVLNELSVDTSQDR